MEKPLYFDAIRQDEAERWNKLEKDPKEAGPWRQLFDQVRRPQHVLSELLQNADDAGAKEATIKIKDNTFTLAHDGDDFTKDDFESLCSFGYSNKRTLHTIGFRGIGFKSTFGLGDDVEIYTPKLSVRFNHNRFTEPIWLGSSPYKDKKIHIRIKNIDEYKQKELDGNLKEWSRNPASLLFFQNLRSICIDEQQIRWSHSREGPVSESEWVSDGKGSEILVVTSKPVPFPDYVLADICRVRRIWSEQKVEFPECTIKILLGMGAGRIYSILPAVSGTGLPFACNAPLIQPPDRSEINHPEESPTNRWLMEHIGKFTAETMCEWLSQEKLSKDERSEAYGLLPATNTKTCAGVVPIDNKPVGNSTGEKCGEYISKEFGKHIQGKEILLTEDGSLVSECIIVPKEILEVWTLKQVAILLGNKRSVLYRNIKSDYQKRIIGYKIADEIDRRKILSILCDKKPPKPSMPDALLVLWLFIAQDKSMFNSEALMPLHIVPVKRKKTLCASEEVIRMDRESKCYADWNFLSKHLHRMDKDWQSFLEQSRSQDNNAEAYGILERIDLNSNSEPFKIIKKVASRLVQNKSNVLSNLIQLAQIASKHGERINYLSFITQDLKCRQAKDIIFDKDGKLENLLPVDYRQSHLLHKDYSKFTSCSKEKWLKWIESGYAGIKTSILPMKKDIQKNGSEFEEMLRECDNHENVPYKKSDKFAWTDYDFDDTYWSHWEGLAKDDEWVWCNIIRQMLVSSESKGTTIKNYQKIKNGRTYNSELKDSIPTAWIRRIRQYRCLINTQGNLRKPCELFLRTIDNNLDCGDSFVHRDLDNKKTRGLLNLLGVREPTDSGTYLDELRKLSKGKDKDKNTSIDRIKRIYHLLNQILDKSEAESIKQALCNKKLVFTVDCSWRMGSEIYIQPDDADPKAPVIHDSIRNLDMWSKIGIEDKPTIDLAIKWLKGLKHDQHVSDKERVEELLRIHPRRIWDECKHWLNLNGELTNITELKYSLTAHHPVDYKHLSVKVKQETADLRQLSNDISGKPPFSQLSQLGTKVKEKLDPSCNIVGSSAGKEWLRVVGAGLQRLKIDDADKEDIRSLAKSLTKVKYCEVEQPKVVPYIGRKSAGEGRSVDVFWDLDNNILYVKHLPRPKLANHVPKQIGKMFKRGDIQNVLYYSFERRPQDIREYLESNFSLSEDVDEANASPPKHKPESTRTSTHTGQAGNTPTDNEGGASTPKHKFNSRHTSTYTRQDNNAPSNKNDSESAADRKKVECKGMELVTEYEKRRNPNGDIKDVSGDNCGYDIKTSDRCIEVKSFSGDRGSPSLTANEGRFAMNNSSKCWLYVVENVFDEDVPLEKKIIPIENPADKLEEISTITYKIKDWDKVRDSCKNMPDDI